MSPLVALHQSPPHFCPLIDGTGREGGGRPSVHPGGGAGGVICSDWDGPQWKIHSASASQHVPRQSVPGGVVGLGCRQLGQPSVACSQAVQPVSVPSQLRPGGDERGLAGGRQPVRPRRRLEPQGGRRARLALSERPRRPRSRLQL